MGDVSSMAATYAGVQRVGVRCLWWATVSAGPIGSREVIAAYHLSGRKRAGLNDLRIVRCEMSRIARASESCMEIVDAAVEHGHLDASAIHAFGLHRSCTDVWNCR